MLNQKNELIKENNNLLEKYRKELEGRKFTLKRFDEDRIFTLGETEDNVFVSTYKGKEKLRSFPIERVFDLIKKGSWVLLEYFTCAHCEEEKEYNDKNFGYWTTNEKGTEELNEVCNTCAPGAKIELGDYLKEDNNNDLPF